MPSKIINLIDPTYHADKDSISFTAECEGETKHVFIPIESLKAVSNLPASADIPSHFDEASHSIIQVLRRYFGVHPVSNPVFLGEEDFS
jgi:hypothetical protein